jgi:hypothetical protein
MAAIEAAQQFPKDCLPPEDTYSSREELFTAINTWAKPRGYAFSTGRSRKTQSGRTSIHFICDRGAGRPSPDLEKRRRKTSIRRTGCQFSVIAKESIDGATWSLRHRPAHVLSYHNHGPSIAPLAHPRHRQISEAHEEAIHGLSSAGVPAREIRSYLQLQSGLDILQQDIHNCIARSKRNLAHGQSNIHALANELDNEGFWNQIRLGQDNRVTSVIFAHPKSLEYLKAYPDVIILDCTYKTNKYKMPLLDIIGVDACQRSFCIAFAFLSGEGDDDYLWALERLRSIYERIDATLPSVFLTDRCLSCMKAITYVFPDAVSILCLWHVNKAVLRHCQPIFTKGTKDNKGLEAWNAFFKVWHTIVASPDEKTY